MGTIFDFWTIVCYNENTISAGDFNGTEKRIS